MRVERMCASFRRTSRGRVSPPGLVTTCDRGEVDSSGGTNASSDTAPFSSLCPPTSPALFYLRDTRLLGPTDTSPGVVPMTISSSPWGAMYRPKDIPAAGTV